MSETKNLQLFKHDNPSTNTEQFDIEKALNENWDKIDDAYGINNINIQELQSKVIALETQNAQLESQIPTGESEGNPIHISDSSNMECEIVVVGNAVQDGEPTPDAPVEIVTVGQNVNFFNKETVANGVFINPSTGSEMSNSVWSQSEFITVKPNTTYTVSSATVFSSGSCIEISSYNDLKEWIKSEQGGTTGDTSYTFTTDATTYYIKLGYRNDKNLSNIQLEKGSVATSYSPYANGLGSVEIDVVNKNMLDLTKCERKGSSCKHKNIKSNSIDLISTHTWSSQAFCVGKLKQNTDFTIRANFLESIALSSKVGITAYGNSTNSFSGLTSIGDYTSNISQNVKEERKITFNTEEYEYIFIRFWVNATGTSVTEGNSLVSVTDIQLEIGSTATEYEEHQSQTIALPIQKEFVKIGDYEDTFIKQNGKWYEKHYIAKRVLDDSAYTTGTVPAGDNIIYAIKNIWNKDTSVRKNIICSHLLYKEDWSSNTNCIFGGGTTEGDLVYFKFIKAEMPTSNDFLNWLAEQYANGTPVEIYYESTTPELIECTEEQVKVLESFKTYKNITNITASGIAKLKVNYKKDLATVINNLSQAIVGGN